MTDSVLLLGSMSLAGWLLVRCFFAGTYRVFAVVLGPFFGLAVWALLFIMVKLFSGEASLFLVPTIKTVTILYILIFAGVFVLNFKVGWPRFSEIVTMLIVLLALAVGHHSLFSKWFVLMSGDTWKMFDPALPFAKSLYRGYPILLQSVHSAALVISVKHYIPSINLALGIGLWGTMTIFCYEQLKMQLNNCWLVIVVSPLPALLLFSSYQGFIHLGYQNHHVFAAFAVLLLVVSLSNDLDLKPLGRVLLGVMGAVIMMLARMEGLLVVYVILYVGVVCEKINNSAQTVIIYVTVLLGSIWVLFLASFLDANATFTFSQMCIVGTSGLLLGGLFYFKNRAHLPWVTLYGVVAIFPIYLFVMLIMFYLDFELLWRNYTIHFENFYENGQWWATWIYLLPTILCILFLRRTYQDLFLQVFVVLFLLNLFIITIRGYPVKANWSDSSNRMLFHYLPILLIWVAVSIAQIRHTTKDNVVLK